MMYPTKDFLPTTAIFVAISVFIITGSLIMSHFAKFNPMGGAEGLYQPEIIYTPIDTHEVLTNTCKFPYIFLMNDDVTDGRDDYSEGCLSNELTDAIRISSEGILTLQGKPETNKALDSIRCTYYKHSGISNQSVEIERNKPQPVPYFSFAVACKREGIVELLKPMVNFAVIPKETPGESVAVLFLPSVNHKIFMKFLSKSKRFMSDNHFVFSKMSTMTEPRPLRDLLLQLGVSREMSLFQKAKMQNFTTFFSGPQQIRELLDVDHDTSAHRNFVFQFLIDDKKCLEDGRRFLDDQLERFQSFLSVTKGSKFFSTFFLDDFGARKKAIDFDLSRILMNLDEEGVFKNTTLVITSYDLSDNETSLEDNKNPLLAVRVSDHLRKQYPQKQGYLNMNFNRMMSSANIYEVLMHFLEPNSTSLRSPWGNSVSIFRSCPEAGISPSACLCMNMSTSSEYPSLEAPFLKEIKEQFTKEVKSVRCVKSFETKPTAAFYSYTNDVKGDVRVVELSGEVKSMGPLGEKTLPVKKTFIFDPMFKSYRSFGMARVQINWGINIQISSVCYV